MQDQPNVPYGFCECGCGQRTRLAPQNHTAQGWVKGEPLRFAHGHHQRLRRSEGPYWIEDLETGCWIWQKSTWRGGYGYYREVYCGVATTQSAHRWVYEQHKGPIPQDLDLDHLCRNPPCVNPDHLEPVTHTENVRRGDAAKLTVADVVAIRGAKPSYGYLLRLAEEYGVSWDTIRNLRAGRGWSEVRAG